MNLEQLQQDKEFMALIGANPDLEAIAAALRARGIEMSAEELRKGLAAHENGELSEDELEEVAGGRVYLPMLAPVVISWLWRVLTTYVK